ncbi:hypothetical protein L208DRAFT_1378703 [Tricholoma matsutake]|nr:hypothetical protein L208DRAFT_1378703 [Tricholoma matsutake 945]
MHMEKESEEIEKWTSGVQFSSKNGALNEDESPKIQTKFVPWRHFLEEWIYPDSPSADFVGYLDWCDIFIGGMDLMVDYLDNPKYEIKSDNLDRYKERMLLLESMT